MDYVTPKRHTTALSFLTFVFLQIKLLIIVVLNRCTFLLNEPCSQVSAATLGLLVQSTTAKLEV